MPLGGQSTLDVSLTFTRYQVCEALVPTWCSLPERPETLPDVTCG